MSGTSNLSPIVLSDKDKLKGYENYTSWKILMEAHGMPKSLHKYWCNKITVPTECMDIEEPDEDADGEDDDKFSKEFLKHPLQHPHLPQLCDQSQPPSTQLPHSNLNMSYMRLWPYPPSSSTSRTYLVRGLIRMPNPMLHGHFSMPNIDE